MDNICNRCRKASSCDFMREHRTECANLEITYEALRTENERLKDLFERLRTWAKAYPLTAFPKPDLKKARKALKDAGMTLDAISADAMRHVLSGITDIVEQALSEQA